jgi:hypothetical protein
MDIGSKSNRKGSRNPKASNSTSSQVANVQSSAQAYNNANQNNANPSSVTRFNH